MENTKFSNGFGQVLSSYNYTYDGVWKDQLSSYNGETITYDNMGNPTTYRDGMTMVWQNGRELKSVTTDEYTVNYTYNADGYRTQKTVIDSDGNEDTTYYYYDDSNKLIGLTNGVNDFVFFYDTNGEISSMWMNNSVYYFFVKNAQGDVVSVITSGGRVQVQYTYDAWGNPISITNSIGTDASSSFYATVLSFMYRGYYYDAETGFYYLNSRYYDPVTGRFINADTYMDTASGTPLSTNMYAYCENNPVMFTDPNGEWMKSEHEKITRKKGFTGTEYATVREWVQKADDDPCKCTDEYTTPFHGLELGNYTALEVAKRLYNLAIDLRGKTSKKTFKLQDISFITYKPRDDSKYEKNKAEAAKKQLLSLLNSYNNAMRQSQMLLGLSLHIMQDYFAHMILVDSLYRVEKRNLFNTHREIWTPINKENGNKIKYIFEVDEAIGVDNSIVEDNITIFPWRYKMSNKITKKAFNKWKYNRKIANIAVELSDKTAVEEFTTGIFKKNWRLKIYKYNLIFS